MILRAKVFHTIRILRKFAFFLFLSLSGSCFALDSLPKGAAYTAQNYKNTVIHILEIDPNHIKLEIALAQEDGLGLETTSSLTKRRGAFAGINGGFYERTGTYNGSSSGILKIHGKFFGSPKNRGALWDGPIKIIFFLLIN